MSQPDTLLLDNQFVPHTASSVLVTPTGGSQATLATALATPVITGGTINGVAIGGTTPAAGAFTTLSATSTTTHGTNTAGAQIVSNGQAGGGNRQVRWQTAAVDRWILYANDDPESGANAGSNWQLRAYADGGSFLFNPLSIARATGVVTMAQGAAITGGTVDSVTIGGSTPAAGTFTNMGSTGYARQSVGNALTAAGTTRTDALALAAQINNITTAAASTGAVLPTAASVGVGATIVVYNGGANAIKMYAAGSETIDGTAGATGVTLTNTKRCAYTPVSTTAWISAQLGAVSA